MKFGGSQERDLVVNVCYHARGQVRASELAQVASAATNGIRLDFPTLFLELLTGSTSLLFLETLRGDFGWIQPSGRGRTQALKRVGAVLSSDLCSWVAGLLQRKEKGNTAQSISNRFVQHLYTAKAQYGADISLKKDEKRGLRTFGLHLS